MRIRTSEFLGRTLVWERSMLMLESQVIHPHQQRGDVEKDLFWLKRIICYCTPFKIMPRNDNGLDKAAVAKRLATAVIKKGSSLCQDGVRSLKA